MQRTSQSGRRLRKVSGYRPLALQVLDGGRHLASVPLRPVIRPGQARHACPRTHRNSARRRALRAVLLAQTDCETLRSVVLTLARNRWRPPGEVSELADAHPLQILDGCPHLLSIPHRPVVAGRQPRHPGAAAHGDETDCETLGSVVLALGQETLCQADRRKLVHERTLPSDSRTAARCSTNPGWRARVFACRPRLRLGA